MWGDDPEDYRRKAYNPATMIMQVVLPNTVELDCGCVVRVNWLWQWGSEHPVGVVVVGWDLPQVHKPWPGSGAVPEYRSFGKYPEMSEKPTYHEHSGNQLDAKIIWIQTELMRRYRTHVMGVSEGGDSD